MTTTPDADPVARLLQRGIAAAGRGDADQAIACFRQCVVLRPDLGAAQANLGLLLVATRRHAEAEPVLRAAASLMPQDAALCNALGVAQETLQRLPEAEGSYRRALAIAPGLAEAHANLGNCLRRQGRLAEAQAGLLRAIELAPTFAVAHFNLGVLLQELGEHERAIVAYRQALLQRPDQLDALNNLGSCLRALGQVEAARAAFERILDLRPTQIEAHCNLAQFKTYRSADPHIEQLLSQRHRVPELPAEGQARYWFTVGKMREDVGEHDASFAAYAEGNRLKRAITPWDEAAHVDLQRRIIATFPGERLARCRLPSTAGGPVPVFIVGMPRSGTSLLEQVLATLPGVHGAGEITWLPEILDPVGEGAHRLEFLSTCSGEQLAAMGRRYIERLRDLAPEATHVIDKLPDNFQHLGLIHLMLPGARIVHAMRDPMDACFSCWSRLFIGQHLAFTYDLGSVGRYWVRYRELMRHWHAALPSGRILDVPYEALVTDLEGQARRLVDHLGLPWDERCLAFHRNPRLVRTASVAQVRRPVYATSVARWKPYERYLEELMAVVRGTGEPVRSPFG